VPPLEPERGRHPREQQALRRAVRADQQQRFFGDERGHEHGRQAVETLQAEQAERIEGRMQRDHEWSPVWLLWRRAGRSKSD